MKKFTVSSLLIHMFLFALMIIVIYPFLYALMCSFKETREILTARSFFPTKFNFDNYKQAWVIANFSRYTWNSAWYSILIVLIALLNSSIGGYVFDRGEFRGKKVIFAMFTSLMFVALGTANIYPQLQILKALKLSNSLWGLIVMNFFGINITNIYLVKSFLTGIPRELDEAANIDGCNFITTFFRVILPLLKPVLATVGIFAFGIAWNDYLWPMIVTLSNPGQRTLSVGMIALKGDANAAASWNLILAGAMISAFPMTLVFLFFNKYFIKGLTAGAVKG